MDVHDWAIVLAGGRGKRLRGLTAAAWGEEVPKQYCSLLGGRSLLQNAVVRAERVAPPGQILAIVAEEHRRWWQREALPISSSNLVVQPENRGTAIGILLPLLLILERDPEARIAILPSDHFVAHELTLSRALREALDAVGGEKRGVILLGMQADSAQTGYGWIVPSDVEPALAPVEWFEEKPAETRAAQLMARGGLWNSFIMAASGQALVRIFERRLPHVLRELERALAVPKERAARLRLFYQRIPSADFSRHVLQGSEDALWVRTVPPCGWTDLGTPDRVAQCLAAHEPAPTRVLSRGRRFHRDLSLAVERARSQARPMQPR